MRGGEDGFQGCMACLRSACGCTARHTRGVQGLKAVRRGLAHRKRSILFVSRCFVFYVIRFHFFKEERGHGESGRLGATRAGSDPPVVILISIMRTKLSTSPPLSP